MDQSNSPELDGKYLGTITQDFVKVSETLKQAAYEIKKRGFSDYPIFPISKVEQPIGTLLLAGPEMDLSWSYYASFLDEFLQRQLIGEEKAAEFMEAYKDPEEFACLFVIEPDFTNFVYIPYPNDGNTLDID